MWGMGVRGWACASCPYPLSPIPRFTGDPRDSLSAIVGGLERETVIRRFDLKTSRLKQTGDDLGRIGSLDVRFVEALVAMLVVAGKAGQHHGRAGVSRIEMALRYLDKARPLQHIADSPIVLQEMSGVHIGKEQAAGPQRRRHARETARQVGLRKQIVQAVVGAGNEIKLRIEN